MIGHALDLFLFWIQIIVIMEDKIFIYQTADGETTIDVKLEQETVWLSANQMALLFDRDDKTIRKHINNAIVEELADSVVVVKFATTTQHGAIDGKMAITLMIAESRTDEKDTMVKVVVNLINREN